MLTIPVEHARLLNPCPAARRVWYTYPLAYHDQVHKSNAASHRIISPELSKCKYPLGFWQSAPIALYY